MSFNIQTCPQITTEFVVRQKKTLITSWIWSYWKPVVCIEVGDQQVWRILNCSAWRNSQDPSISVSKLVRHYRKKLSVVIFSRRGFTKSNCWVVPVFCMQKCPYFDCLKYALQPHIPGVSGSNRSPGYCLCLEFSQCLCCCFFSRFSGFLSPPNTCK